MTTPTDTPTHEGPRGDDRRVTVSKADLAAVLATAQRTAEWQRLADAVLVATVR